MLTMTPDLVGLDSRSVADLLGVSYRQLDYAIRSTPALAAMPTMAGGSGSPRRFDLDTLRRLDLAARFAAADPTSDARHSRIWLAAVGAAVAGRTPPPARGFATLTPGGQIRYGETAERAVPLGVVGLVIRYDLACTDLGAHLESIGYPAG